MEIFINITRQNYILALHLGIEEKEDEEKKKIIILTKNNDIHNKRIVTSSSRDTYTVFMN